MTSGRVTRRDVIMVRPPSLYDLLGVDQSATPDQLKAAYHRAARTLHPDVGGSAPAFARVTAAYQILRDPAGRAHYDRVLAARGSGGAGATAAQGPGTGPSGTTPPPAGAQPRPPAFPGVSLAARRRYLAMMALALTLFVLAGTVVRPLSVPAAIGMAVVAMLIPPVAAIMANRPAAPRPREPRPGRSRRRR
jgi:hypothetical protein